MLVVIAEVLARVANSILFVLLTWRLGEMEASRYTLGFTFALFLIQFSLGGLDQLLTREVSKAPNRGGIILGTFLLARCISSLLLYMALIAWIAGPFGYDSATNQIVLIVGATFIPDSLTALCQAFLIARDRVAYVTLLGALTGVFKLILGFAAIWLGGGALIAAIIVLMTSCISLLFHVTLITTRFTSLSISLEPAFLVEHARSEWPLLLIAILTTLEGTIDAILLSRRIGTLEVGVYAASMLFLNALMIVPAAFRQIILPEITVRYATQRERAFDVYTQSARALLIVTLLLSASLTVNADQIVPIVYRDHFSSAIPVLQILIWSFVFTTLLVPGGRLMLAAGRQAMFVPLLIGSLSLNVVLNLWLQPSLGAIGAAVARVSSSALMLALSFMCVQRIIYRWHVMPVLIGPLVATLTMIAVNVGLRWVGVQWIVALGISWLVYAGLIVILRAVSAAELRRLRDLLLQRIAPLTPP
ncbi:polysaccharide biosynthesis C-terminal domain-containing protein [Roseiflexus sp.]|uniref:oligosaccharide flippase family protein n=2 Tax=Roseiflexus sp. TaxID=2562120 RepID=UPI00398A7AFE